MCRSYLKIGRLLRVWSLLRSSSLSYRNPQSGGNLRRGQETSLRSPLPMKERNPYYSMRIVESGPSIDKPKSVSNCYTRQIQEANGPLRIPKLVSSVRKVESFNNHSNYNSSPHIPDWSITISSKLSSPSLDHSDIWKTSGLWSCIMDLFSFENYGRIRKTLFCSREGMHNWKFTSWSSKKLTIC